MLGICNGFQVLCEARLLPGALLPTPTGASSAARSTRGRAHATPRSRAPARPAQRLSIPAKHTWGRYYADDATLERARARRPGRAALRAGQNFNGSLRDIAGVRNEAGNVFGLMPHPEHAVDALTGSADGLRIFASMRLAVEGARA